MKNLSTTRWSCNHEAVKALAHGYHQIKEALTEINTDEEQKDIKKNEASGLIQNMARLETAIYIEFWHNILERDSMQPANICKVLRWFPVLI